MLSSTANLHRRTLVGWSIVAAALNALPLARAFARTQEKKPMNVVCHIRYEIDPYKRAQFEEYAKVWLTAIPKCGGQLIGYFMPATGTNYVAHAMIGLESLAAYEAYQARLRADPASVANFQFAEREKFILREEREFLRQVT